MAMFAVQHRGGFVGLSAVLLLALMLGPISAQVDCATDHTVSTQAEIDHLYQCAEAGMAIEGDVRFSSNAAGRLEIRNVGAIAGKIIVEDNDALEALQLETDYAGIPLPDGASTSLILRNALALTQVSGGAAGAFVTVEMRDVSALDNVSLPNLPPPRRLSVVNAKALSTFNLGSASSPKNAIAGTIELRDVGLPNLDAFFRGGMKGQNISVAGTLNVEVIRYGLVNAMNVSISTKGPVGLSVVLGNSKDIDGENPPSDSRVEFLEVSAVREFAGEGDNFPAPSVGTFTIRDTELSHPVVRFKDLNNLVVHNNLLLKDIHHGDDFARYSWKSISIKNNPSWIPEIRHGGDPEKEGGWVWPEGTVESVELVGHFERDIFTEWIDRGKQSGELLVTKKFMLESWAVTDGKKFDCGPLDELHDKGILQGEYSCRGVDDNGSAQDRKRAMVLAFICIFMAIFL